MTPRITTALLFLAGVVPFETGCAHSAHLRPELPALEMAAAPRCPRIISVANRAGGVSEEALRAILDAPVLLDESQRVGINAPWADSYQPERGPPLTMVAAELMRSLDAAGVFQATSKFRRTGLPTPASLASASWLRATAPAICSSTGSGFIDETYVNAWLGFYPP